MNPPGRSMAALASGCARRNPLGLRRETFERQREVVE
jgi:hypothetical protein